MIGNWVHRVTLVAGLVLPAGIAAQVADGGDLFYGERDSYGELSPYHNRTESAETARILTLVYESLYRFDFDRDEYEPILAAGPWAGATMGEPAHFTVTVPLKPGVKWHDDRDFTAEDVVFSYQYMRHGANAELKKALDEGLIEVRAQSDYEVTFVFADGVVDPGPYLNKWIIPAHVFDTETMAFRSAAMNLRDRPVGTGPFRFQARESQTADFTRNDDYHRGAPILDKVGYTRLNDVNALMSSLEVVRGGLQLVTEVPPSVIPRVRDNQSLSYGVSQGHNVWAVALRQTPNSILNDSRIREALSLAVDRENLLDVWYQGEGTVVAGPIAPGGPFHNADLGAPVYDPERAREIVQASGLDVSQPLRLIYGTESEISGNVVQALENSFESIGIPVETVQKEPAEFQQSITETYDFDMVYLQWQFDPTYNLRPLFHTDEIGPGGLNIMNYSNPEVDGQLDNLQLQSDPGFRRQMSRRLQALLARERPAIFLFTTESIYAYRAEWGLLSVNPLYFFTNVHRWFRVSG